MKGAKNRLALRVDVFQPYGIGKRSFDMVWVTLDERMVHIEIEEEVGGETNMRPKVKNYSLPAEICTIYWHD